MKDSEIKAVTDLTKTIGAISASALDNAGSNSTDVQKNINEAIVQLGKMASNPKLSEPSIMKIHDSINGLVDKSIYCFKQHNQILSGLSLVGIIGLISLASVIFPTLKGCLTKLLNGASGYIKDN